MATRVLLFDADGNDTELPFTAQNMQQPGERQLLWVDLGPEVPGNLHAVLSGLGLDGQTLAQLPDFPPGVRRLTQHDGQYVTLSVRAAGQDAQSFTPLNVVAGKNFVITVQPQDIVTLSEFREQMQGDTQLGQLDSAGFLVVLLSRLLETYFQAVSRLEESTDRLDEHLLSTTRPDREPLTELAALRRQAGVLRRELAAHRPLFMHLASPDFVVYAGDEGEARFTLLLEQYQHALGSLEAVREEVLGSFDLYMSSLGQRTNDIMRVLTIVTVAMGLLSAVAGLMGMNFQADIFKTGNRGFYSVLIGTGLLIIGVLLLIRWRKWL